MKITGFLAALLLTLASTTVGAQAFSDYSIAELLKPCMEGDSSARWGENAETECEQYIKGFTDAYMMYRSVRESNRVCLPQDNRPDEIRWAFMKWANAHYDERERPAAEGLEATLTEAFACAPDGS